MSSLKGKTKKNYIILAKKIKISQQLIKYISCLNKVFNLSAIFL